MGFSVERGDGLEVVNSPFTRVESEDEQRAWWQDRFWQDFLFSMGRWLLVGLGALLLFLLVLRPMLKRYARQAPAPVARPAQAQARAPTPAPAAVDEAGEEPEPVAPRRRRDTAVIVTTFVSRHCPWKICPLTKTPRRPFVISTCLVPGSWVGPF